jgi:hypothetical protein
LDLRRLKLLLEANPRIALIVAIPLVAFIVTIGLTLARSGGDDSPSKLDVSLQNSVTSPTIEAPSATAAPAATATPVPGRTSCSEIQGTSYRSDAERDWYLANCTGAASASTGAPSGGGGTGAARVPNTRYGVETPLGHRLVINSIGVNASVSAVSVGGDGVMPNPIGYDNVVLYDFSAIPGLGGSNKVIAGHVDCGRCRNGGPGLAVLYYLRNVGTGDQIQYCDPACKTYTVTLAADYSPNHDWASIVASGAADITIITCTGTFTGGEYTLRRVVQARGG